MNTTPPEPRDPAAGVPELSARQLETLTAELEDAHPYVHLISLDQDWRFLVLRASQELRGEGVILPTERPLTSREILTLRERIAKLSDRYGPALTGATPAEAEAAGARAREAEARRLKLGLPRAPSKQAPAGGAVVH
jgi:hypothetical protein